MEHALQLEIAPRVLPLPSWLPPPVRAALAGRHLGRDLAPLVLPRSLRRVLKRPEKISVSAWAMAHRVVTDGAHEGSWRRAYAPHTVAIMDAFGEASTREIWFCGCEQSGKTNTMLNCLAWAIDCAPGNMFYLMPTESDSAKVVGRKLRPMLTRSPRLARYLTGRADDATLAQISLNNGTMLFPAHANSASSMASWSARYCFGDEVDKYPERAGLESDPITLIKKRTRTYRGRHKHFFASTPAGRFIHRGTMACHQVWQFFVRCPHCDGSLAMAAEHLVLPEDATPERVELEGAGYACHLCGSVWGEQERLAAIRAGSWVAIKGGELARPEKIGFHHRAWECLDVPLKEIAVAWLKAKSGRLADRIGWANGYEAVDYVYEQQDRQEEQILRLVDPSMPRGVCPRNPAGLVLVVDTQKRGFFYQVWAYGWGPDLESWRIDHGFVEGFKHLGDLAAKRWQDADGKSYGLRAAFIDSGGGTDPHNPRHSRTAEVYEFCRRNPVFKPLKGRRNQAQPWTVTRLDYYPSRSGKKIPIPGGLSLYVLDVTYFKNELATKLLIEPTDPGAFHLHADCGEDYARQLCAEYQDERGYWICPRGRENHHWDLGVYGMAAAEIMGVRNWRPAAGPAVRVHSKGVTSA
jgi:terminase, large subunit